MSNRTVVISPSGNLYGSEQVLCDYLASTGQRFDVYVPRGTRLAAFLNGSRHRIIHFGNVKMLYVAIALKLLARQYRVVYVNEGGHSRYIQVLAKLFASVRFVVHVRIMEDTAPDRWAGQPTGNIRLVAISDYVQRALPIPGKLVYDLYRFPGQQGSRPGVQAGRTDVAVIGRLSISKGFRELVCLVQHLQDTGNPRGIFVNIYGHVSDEVKRETGLELLRSSSFVKFHGFVNGADIYKHNRVVLHLSKTEPLGRIYFEAVAAGLPLVGFRSGGIGEIASKVGLTGHLVSPGGDESREIAEKVTLLADDHPETTALLAQAFLKMKEIYSTEKYTREIDELLSV